MATFALSLKAGLKGGMKKDQLLETWRTPKQLDPISASELKQRLVAHPEDYKWGGYLVYRKKNSARTGRLAGLKLPFTISPVEHQIPPAKDVFLSMIIAVYQSLCPWQTDKPNQPIVLP